MKSRVLRFIYVAVYVCMFVFMYATLAYKLYTFPILINKVSITTLYKSDDKGFLFKQNQCDGYYIGKASLKYYFLFFFSSEMSEKLSVHKYKYLL